MCFVHGIQREVVHNVLRLVLCVVVDECIQRDCVRVHLTLANRWTVAVHVDITSFLYVNRNHMYFGIKQVQESISICANTNNIWNFQLYFNVFLTLSSSLMTSNKPFPKSSESGSCPTRHSTCWLPLKYAKIMMKISEKANLLHDYLSFLCNCNCFYDFMK